jgi:hypothetical protein
MSASAPGPHALVRAPSVPPAPTASADLIDSVRNWVHFDNLAESLQKQVSNVRTLRSTYEDKILRHLEATSMRSAVLEITGAKLQRATRPKTTDLSWSFLETTLHEFYKTRGKPDETTAVLEFLQTKRDTKQIPYLKKTPV